MRRLITTLLLLLCCSAQAETIDVDITWDSDAPVGTYPIYYIYSTKELKDNATEFFFRGETYANAFTLYGLEVGTWEHVKVTACPTQRVEEFACSAPSETLSIPVGC